MDVLARKIYNSFGTIEINEDLFNEILYLMEGTISFRVIESIKKQAIKKMTQNSKTIFSKIAPKQSDAMYWVDLSENSEGAVVKYWDGNTSRWVSIIDSALNPIEGLVETLQNTIKETSTKVKDIEKSITDSKEDISKNIEDISGINTALDLVNTITEDLKTKFTKINEDFLKLTSDFKDVSTAVSATDAKVNSLEDRIVALEAK